jgi:hypothetical protein
MNPFHTCSFCYNKKISVRDSPDSVQVFYTWTFLFAVLWRSDICNIVSSHFHRIFAITEILSYCYIKPHDVCYIKPPPTFEALLVMLLPFEIGILYNIFPLYFAVTYFVSSEDYAGALLNIKYNPFLCYSTSFSGVSKHLPDVTSFPLFVYTDILYRALNRILVLWRI